MRLAKARVTNYRSVNDSGVFEVESKKTILVGANEAGKSAILQALQHLKRPDGVVPLHPLRDFPRSRYDEITRKQIEPAAVTVVRGDFALEPSDVAAMPAGYESITYWRERRLDDKTYHGIEGAPLLPTIEAVKKDVVRLVSHLRRDGIEEPRATAAKATATALEALTATWPATTTLISERANLLRSALEATYAHIDESSTEEEARYDRLLESTNAGPLRDQVLETLSELCPTFILFNNYFRVRPRIQLDHLARRVEQKLLDDDSYDYGNLCLLRLLGFTPKALSDLAAGAPPDPSDSAALRDHQDRLDSRQYQLNAAGLRLTNEIVRIWNPDSTRGEAARVRINSDGQYLKLVVEDSIGVEVELDQRSEGFQWLVSFFIVFFAEAADKHKNAILLLDEPGVSLHGIKQREFRGTLSKLAETNQTIFTTHSPFLVGPDELDFVRVVEMRDRAAGTKVSLSVAASDSPALLPLQEALGYDLAQSLFAQSKNLVLEGLTDYWYLEATAELFATAGQKALDEKIALVPAGNAGKVVYFATILHAHKLKVAALLDSDAAGDQAAKQDTLVHTLGQKCIIRTRDAYAGPVQAAEVEDMLRHTLIDVAKADLGWDVAAAAAGAPASPIVNVFAKAVPDFSKYKLAKAFLRWCRSHALTDLQTAERDALLKLLTLVNKALK
jgi:hypothetical protein